MPLGLALSCGVHSISIAVRCRQRGDGVNSENDVCAWWVWVKQWEVMEGGCVVAPCLVVIDGTLHSQMPSDTGAVQRVHRAWPSQTMQEKQRALGSAGGNGHGELIAVGREANGCRLTSDLRRRGFQACAVRQEPCRSCSSSVVGQNWRRSSSEHWRSCSRSRQRTWSDGRRDGNCGCWSRRDRRGGKGVGRAEEVRAAQDRHSMRRRVRTMVLPERSRAAIWQVFTGGCVEK
jgi:hypothetical protein